MSLGEFNQPFGVFITSDGEVTEPDNTAPSVTITGGTTSLSQGQVVLTANITDDPEDTHTYLWSSTSSNVTFSNTTSQSVVVTGIGFSSEVVNITCEVTDQGSLTGSDTHSITFSEYSPPAVVNSANQSVEADFTVSLLSTITVGQSPIVSYLWTQTSGETVTLTGAETTSASFTSPSLSTVSTLEFLLTVTDSLGQTSSDTTTITVAALDDTVENTAPTVLISGGTSGASLGQVILMANISDSSSDTHSYLWSSEDSVTFSNTNSQTVVVTGLGLTAYTASIKCEVTDQGGLKGEDLHDVNFLEYVPASIVIPATSDVLAGNSVTITANVTVGQANIVSYQWLQSSGSAVENLQGVNTPSITFDTVSSEDDDTAEFVLRVVDTNTQLSAAFTTVGVTGVPDLSGTTSRLVTNYSTIPDGTYETFIYDTVNKVRLYDDNYTWVNGAIDLEFPVPVGTRLRISSDNGVDGLLDYVVTV